MQLRNPCTRWGAILALVVLAGAGPEAARAEEPARGERADDEEVNDLLDMSLEDLSQIEVLTVTARRRQESAQETPVAVTAFSEESLEARGVKRLDELAKFVPNLTFNDSSLRGASIYIRGVGQRDTRQFLEPGVGVYVDGVYVARQSALLPVVDVERIEVLRGPQGTLYGRNTIGGAINYVTVKPGPDFEAFADLNVGNYGLLQSRGSLNVPILDDLLSSRFTVATRTRDGYTHNLRDGSEWDDDSLLAGSGALRFTPLDFLTIDAKGYYTRQNMHQRAGKCFVTDPLNPTVVGFQAANFLFGASNPDLHAVCNRDSNAPFYDFSASTSGIYQLETYGVTGAINVDNEDLWIFDSSNLKNTAAWIVQSEWDKQNDVDSTEAVVIDRTFYSPQDITTISEELTWTAETTLGDVLPFLPGKVGEGAVFPTVGMYFSWESSGGGLQDNLAVGGGNPLIVPIPDGGGGFVPFDITQSSNPQIFNQPQIDNKSRAAYTQWTFEVLPLAHLTGGVRYTWEYKSLERFEPLATGFRSDTYSKWTPMANLTLLAPEPWREWAHSDSAILYYNYAAGFKSGGFNETTDTATGDIIPAYAEENLNSHEIGLKLDLVDSRVTFNAAWFYNKYDDMQLTVIRVDGNTGEVGSSVTNAGESTVTGFEIELVTTPVTGLQINASTGFVDAHYDVFIDSTPGGGGTVDRSDEPFFDIPKWTANAGVQYTVVLDDFLPRIFGRFTWGRLTPRYDYAFFSKRAYHLTRAGYETGLFDQGATSLHDFRLTWESESLRYRVAFWMKNAFDAEYINGAIDLTDFFGTGATRVGAPRTWGFEMGYAFF